MLLHCLCVHETYSFSMSSMPGNELLKSAGYGFLVISWARSLCGAGKAALKLLIAFPYRSYRLVSIKFSNTFLLQPFSNVFCT